LLAGLAGLLGASARAEKQEELNELKTRIEALHKELSESEQSKNETRDALKESERAISEASRRLRESTKRLTDIKAELSRLQAETKDVQSKLAEQKAALAQMLSQMHRHGEHEALKLLLNARDPAEISRHMHYYGYVVRARAELLEALRSNLVTLDRLARESREWRDELAQAEASLRAETTRLQAQKKERMALLQKLSKKIQSQQKEISTLKEDEAQLTRLIERLKKLVPKRRETPAKPPAANKQAPNTVDDDSPFQRLRGKLKLPVKGELAHLFGSQREGSGLLWKGVFILARAGEEVRAIAPGKVVFADWLRGFGNLLIVDHGHGYMSLYGSNEALFKRVGDGVSSDDVIASVGNSGGNSGSGLYFELRYQGKPLDPMSWVTLK
jgi:murein hydrolase activator